MTHSRGCKIYKYFSDLAPSPNENRLFGQHRNALRKRLLEEGKITKEQTVCHHICPIWRYFDHERYIACAEEDVEFITPQQHDLIHKDWLNREKDYGYLSNMFIQAAKDYGVVLIDYWNVKGLDD